MNAVEEYEGKVIPAGVALADNETNAARDEVGKEIAAEKVDYQTHVTDNTTQTKAHIGAVLTWRQTVSPVALAADIAITNETATDGGTLAADSAAALKKGNTAREDLVDAEVGDGETLVDKEANANGNYVKAKTDEDVAAANAEASQETQTVAAEPDADFANEVPGSSITGGGPGIFIDIDGQHVDFALPLIDPTSNTIIGYTQYSFAARNWGQDGAWKNIFWTTNMPLSRTIMLADRPDYDPTLQYDYFVKSTWWQWTQMLRYANDYASQPRYYDLITGHTCVGFCTDTMDAGNMWPKLRFLPWASGLNYDQFLQYWFNTDGKTCYFSPNENPLVKLPAFNLGVAPKSNYIDACGTMDDTLVPGDF